MFFALWPDASTRQALRRLQRLPEVAAGRRVHPEDIHLTLAFLGQVEDDRLPCLEAAADAVQGVPFSMQVARLGHWRGPRVAWAAPTECPAGLAELEGRLWERLASCGFEREARPFSPHITLARKARPFEARPLPEPIPWEAHDFVLVTSLSDPGGARYEVLRRWPLQLQEKQG